MITPIKKLKEWFKTGAKPTQEQFHALIDSYIHKEEDMDYLFGKLQGSTYMGVATPDSVPPVPTQKVYYIANEVGTYPNYGGLNVADGEIAFFTYNGSWSKVALEDVASRSFVDEKVAELESNLGTHIGNKEYIRAYVDSEGKFLWGIKSDGSIEWAKGVPTPVCQYIENKIKEIVEDVSLTDKIDSLKEVIDFLDEFSNDNSLYIELTAIKESIKNEIDRAKSEEAKKVDKIEGKSLIDENIAENLSLEENPEYIQAVLDDEGKILEAIKADGKKVFAKQELFEKITTPEEFLELTLDSDDRILSYRDKQGVKHENKMAIKNASIEHFDLSHDNANQIKQALDDIDFTPKTHSNYSNNEVIELPIPRTCAMVRLNVSRMPKTKIEDIAGTLEYNDKDGNYFKKDIILNSQGSSSMAYIRADGSCGNLSVDFADCKIKFGNWVLQDSFHIKKYYIDAFRGQCVVGYHLMEQVYQTHPYGERKPYDIILKNESITNSFGSIKKDFNTGALCHPDGFPIVIYVNKGNGDEYYGVYAWCLKKHRDNYYCNKSNANNIILDGIIANNTIFGGNIDWTKFEIRNPKGLIDINDDEYDGENPKELSNTDTLSLTVKNNIIRLSGVNAAMSANLSKETFEQYFLPKYYIDFYIVSQVLYNIDGFHKNWIWCTWDGRRWTPTLYDVDSIFGMMPIGTYVNLSSSNSSIISGSTTNYLTTLYATEIQERYHQLRNKGIFSVDNIVRLLENWLERIGYENLKNDLEQYNETPSYRDSKLNSNNWQILQYTWTSNDNYDSTKTYNIGDKVYSYGYELKAIAVSTNIPPFTNVYDNAPRANGFFNSVQRVKNWLINRIAFLDNTYNYNNQ